MARGIDIYRYQTVTDWVAVWISNVKYIWVKVSDGGAPALVSGDEQVHGAKSVGIPVGGYCYAQKGDPVRHALAFCKELDRLDAWGIIPALDLESNPPNGPVWTGAQARDYAIPFLYTVKNHNATNRRVALYANTSELKAMDALRICNELGDVVIWEASYGSNNGKRNALPANNWAPFRGVHQYTSKGRISGIDGDVDLNESFVDLRINKEADMQQNEILRREWDGKEITVKTALMENWQNSYDILQLVRVFPQLLEAATNNPDLTREEIAQIVRDNSGADPTAIRAAILEGLTEASIHLADDVVDRMADRIANK